jgi:hypothetical protein
MCNAVSKSTAVYLALLKPIMTSPLVNMNATLWHLPLYVSV